MPLWAAQGASCLTITPLRMCTEIADSPNNIFVERALDVFSLSVPKFRLQAHFSGCQVVSFPQSATLGQFLMYDPSPESASRVFAVFLTTVSAIELFTHLMAVSKVSIYNLCLLTSSTSTESGGEKGLQLKSATRPNRCSQSSRDASPCACLDRYRDETLQGVNILSHSY
jgi:hypothetical protein